MAQARDLPNRLLSDGRAVLTRFGCRMPREMPGDPDWAAQWRRLRWDFATSGRPEVPALDALSGAAAAAAHDYMRSGLAAAAALDRCEALHARLFAEGIATALVEEYAAAREAYEDAVEAFGAAGARLARLLFDA